jgi:excinuclease ABC subunit A
MGPEGGTGGGRVVATGTPEDVAAIEESHTGAFLREILGDRVEARGPGGRTSRGRPAKAATTGGKSTGTTRASGTASRTSGTASRAKPAAARKPRTATR